MNPISGTDVAQSDWRTRQKYAVEHRDLLRDRQDDFLVPGGSGELIMGLGGASGVCELEWDLASCKAGGKLTFVLGTLEATGHLLSFTVQGADD